MSGHPLKSVPNINKSPASSKSTIVTSPDNLSAYDEGAKGVSEVFLEASFF